MNEIDRAGFDLPALNMALARALGFENPERLARVELVIESGQLPSVKATLHLRQADGLVAVMEELRLVPQALAAEEARDAA